MSSLNGDAPCAECGTSDNILWFTDSVLWNSVVRRADGGSLDDYAYAESRWGGDPILCIRCFVTVAEERGYRPTGWRLLADWPWVGEG